MGHTLERTFLLQALSFEVGPRKFNLNTPTPEKDTTLIIKQVLLHFSWRRGFKPATEKADKDSRGQGVKGLFSKDFISAFDIISISVILYVYKQGLYNFCQTFNSL
jgi:hypothetical protein